ncbi:hypothetical protein [Kutzneria albida]|uniref:Uncharacterized protein n=1 Tax=Kutzneria albida DSM 43870 TaxID=1449976 RepID=W5WBW4_9PSEU|nr:hypothetical protein [Kutzneria albida]AHH98240.1 hypothetical protein KALB_4878 [Kutzneria albida DSM 43870]
MADIDALRGHVETLAGAMETWALRDDSKAQPGVRQAANTAVDSIDALSRELHEMRDGLITGIRQYDDATAARADALIARINKHLKAGA